MPNNPNATPVVSWEQFAADYQKKYGSAPAYAQYTQYRNAANNARTNSFLPQGTSVLPTTGINSPGLSPMGSSMGGAPSFMTAPAPGFGGNSRGAGFLGKAGSFLGKDDNWAKLGGLVLGGIGAYQEGKAADRQQDMQQAQIDEENRRYADQRERNSSAAMQTSPYLKAMMEELQKRLAAQAGV